MNPQSAAASLEALSALGSVYGVLLARGSEVLHRAGPFPAETFDGLAATFDDIGYYFQRECRDPDQLAFGYGEGHLVVLMIGDLRLVLFHREGEEIDELAAAGRAFLKDYATGLLVAAEAWAG